MDYRIIIQSFLTPFVLISACGLLHLAFASRLTVIVGRIRTFNKEQNVLYIELCKLKEAKKTNEEIYAAHKNRFNLIAKQIKNVIKRAKLMRRLLLLLQSTILLLILSSLSLGLSAVYPSFNILNITLVTTSLLTLFASILTGFREMLLALDPVNEETTWLLDEKILP